MLGADQFTQLATDTPFPEMVLISLIAVAIVWVPGRWWRSRSVATVSGVRTEYAIPSDQALTLRERIWVARVRTGRRLATLPRYGDRLLTYWTWSIALVVLIAIGVEVRAAGQWGLPVLPMPLFWEWTRAGHATAATLMVLFLFPGLAMIRLAFRHRKGRRSVGVVWDVASFWPRRFHPFAAPSYAERAVPELRDRVKAYLDEGKGVVLSAHSQGSVIAFAALSQISGLTATLDGAPIGNLLGYENPFDSGPAEYARAQPYSTRLNRVSLITYGSPLTELYGRLLPSYFGTEGLFNNLRNELAGGGGEHSWRHFYRPTDYIGKRVFAYPGGCLPDDQRCGIDDLPSDASPDRRLLESTRKGDGIPQRMLPHESHSNYGRELALRNHHDAAVAALADLPAVEALP
jgi:hypothetical protein